jgi:hypothetical protein
MNAIIEHSAAFMDGALAGYAATALRALAHQPDAKQTPEPGHDKWPCAVKLSGTTEIYLSKRDSDEGPLGLAISIYEAESDSWLHNYHTLDQARQMRAQLDAIIAQIEQRLPDRVEFDEATGRVTVSKGGAA